MARQTNGTDQSLQSAANLDLSGHPIITLACWLYLDAFANDDRMALEFSTNLNSNSGFTLDPNASDGTVFVGFTGGGAYWLDSFPRPSAATWLHYIIEMDRTNRTNKVWIGNAAQTLTTVLHDIGAGTNFGSYVLYAMSRANTSLFLAGRIAELAIYSGTITSGNRASLQTDAPAIVGTPIFYWPICGVASPEPADAGGIDLTVNGATSVADPAVLNGSLCAGGGGFIAFPYPRGLAGGLSLFTGGMQ